jgi:hypothetical protein
MGLATWLLVRPGAPAAGAAPAVSDADRRRLHDEVEALDG